MAALVAAFLIHTTDRTAWLAGLLAPRGVVPVVCGIALAVVATNALAAFGGTLLAPEMSPNARDLLLALALLAAGLGAFWPPRPPRAANQRIGALLAGLLGAATLALGDRTLFVTLALAARAGAPALAAIGPVIGAVIGALAVIVPAALLGERGRRRLPLRAIRIGIGAVLSVAGAIQAFGALRLI